MIPSEGATGLVIVDVQVGLDEPRLGRRNNPDAEWNMARLLGAWRDAGRPVFHVQHMSVELQSPLRPELPGNAIKSIVAPLPGEPLVRKSASCAFVGTDLEGLLRAAGVEALVVVGLTTEHCVSSTARAASDLGFRTVVVADATACHDRTGFDGAYYPAEQVHTLALIALQDEFATIARTADLLHEAEV